MELFQNIDLTLTVTIIGSLLGSIKSALDTNKEVSKCVKAFNVLIGIYCGINIAYTFDKDLDLGYIGLISLVGSMVGTNILEVISDLAPDITKKYIKGKLK